MKKDCLASLRVFWIVASLIFLAACGDDGNDGTTGPGDGASENPVAAGYAAISKAYEATVVGNGASYASMEYFGPAVRARFASPPLSLSTREGSDAPLQTCIPLTMQGVLFRYDVLSSTYLPTEDAGAPMDGARFILYDVDSAGNPVIPLAESGYLDVECRGAAEDTVSVRLVNGGGVFIFDMEFRGLQVRPPDYILGASPGTFRSPAGTLSLSVLFSGDGTVDQNMNPAVEIVGGLEQFDPRVQNFRASIGLDDSSLDASGMPMLPYDVLASGAYELDVAGQVLLWNAAVAMGVAANGVIENIVQGIRAPLEFEDRRSDTNGILACFSGMYNDPLLENSASGEGCAVGVITNPIVLNSEDVAAIKAGYLALVELLESTATTWGIAAEVMVP